MATDSPKQLAQKLIASGLVPPNSLIGCTEQEIDSLETQFNVHLPASYKALLRVMGKDDGNYLSDCCWTYETLSTFVRASAAENAEMYKFKLEPSWFVFLNRDSCFFLFDTLAGDDPPVIRWCKDEGFKQVWASFSSWFTDMVNEDIQGHAKVIAREAAIKVQE